MEWGLQEQSVKGFVAVCRVKPLSLHSELPPSAAVCGSCDKPVLLLLSAGFQTNGAPAPGIYHLEDALLLSCDISLHFYAHLYN